MGMPLRFFHIPSREPGPAQGELLSFLSQHRIVTIDRRFVEDAQNSFWALCVDYLETEMRGGPLHGAPGRAERKIDYKEVLSAEQFLKFAQLRELRKKLAERDGIPVYAVFSNEQLAAMVQRGVTSRAALREIEGVGEAKVERYADVFLGTMTGDNLPTASPQ